MKHKHLATSFLNTTLFFACVTIHAGPNTIRIQKKKNIIDRTLNFTTQVGIPVIGGSAGTIAACYVIYDILTHLDPKDRIFPYHPYLLAGLLGLTSWQSLQFGLDNYADIHKKKIKQKTKKSQSLKVALNTIRIAGLIATPFLILKNWGYQNNKNFTALARCIAIPIALLIGEGFRLYFAQEEQPSDPNPIDGFSKK